MSPLVDAVERLTDIGVMTRSVLGSLSSSMPQIIAHFCMYVNDAA